ncbi:MAG: glycoside hydrolase family 99-like domain-containing protein [Thermoanaerobaculia bacterium]
MVRRRFAAYYYPGWHFDPLRNPDPEWSEWDIVLAARPRAEWHRQPLIPAAGPRRDNDPATVRDSIELARAFGIDAFIACFYWNAGTPLLAKPLALIRDEGSERFGLGLMWVNRLPYASLPLRATDSHFVTEDGVTRHTIVDGRLVHTTPDDFLAMIDHLATAYFASPGYLTIDGAPILQVYSVDDLLLDLGREVLPRVIAEAKARLRRRGFSGLHLIATVHRRHDWMGIARELGFSSATSYVLLPEWSGAPVQQYAELAERRAREWSGIATLTGLPYSPAAVVGWDSSARGEWQPVGVPLYPWSPVVVGNDAQTFRAALRSAAIASQDGLVRIASWNEWSEGHYLEPDLDRGTAMLEAVLSVRRELVG